MFPVENSSMVLRVSENNESLSHLSIELILYILT